MKKFVLVLSLLVMMVTIGAGCSNTNIEVAPSATSQVNTQASPNTITIEDFAFKPDVISVRVGDVVMWKHNDGAVHTIVSANLFESPTLNRDDEFVYSFMTPGEYEYHCGVHPSMKGKIIVQ